MEDKIVYVLFVFLLCISNYISYKNIKQNISTISQKKSSYILTIRASITLFILSMYLLYNYILDTDSFINYKNKNIHFIQIFTILYFISYLISDIFIGKKFYHDEMQGLSGYIHHYTYIYINIVVLLTKTYNIFTLFLLEELPTFFLGIGSINEKYRNNKLFGLVFLLTRIIYHIILIYLFRNNSLILYPSIIISSLHLYWFFLWIKKYFLK